MAKLNDPADKTLRPQTLADFGGQPAVSRELSIILGGSAARGDHPDHILLAGPPGLGKTTLANIVSNETALPLVATTGPAIERPGDLVALLTSLVGPSVVFIDEIHRIPATAEEILYTAMEDGRVDIIVGEATNAQSINLPLPPFVLVGATTQAGMLSAPLRDRFGYIARLRLYDTEALTAIVARSAALLGMALPTDAAAMIASRARGTPRIANTMLRRVRDWADSHGLDTIGVDDTAAALDAFGIDEAGLDHVGRELLEALCTKFGGGPVGLSTLATTVGDTPDTIERVYEPYLMHIGFLARTPRGRIATPAAWEHLGRKAPGGEAGQLGLVS